jgi:hypothetical protein
MELWLPKYIVKVGKNSFAENQQIDYLVSLRNVISRMPKFHVSQSIFTTQKIRYFDLFSSGKKVR